MNGMLTTHSSLRVLYLRVRASWIIGEYPWNGAQGKGCQDSSFSGGSKVRSLLVERMRKLFFSPTEFQWQVLTFFTSFSSIVLLSNNNNNNNNNSPFFVQPVFRDDGFFMMVSQFQAPNHFLMAYLEDFKMDPTSAQPLLTFSIFDDYADSKDLTLVRADILNRGLHDDDGFKVVQHMVQAYLQDEEYMSVHAFNKKPETFDYDDYISRQNLKWKQGEDADDTSS
jgi:hypothetical protein